MNSNESSESTSITSVFLCTEQVAGVIIGRGGSRIREISESTNTKMVITGKACRIRYLKVTGKPSDISCVASTISDIFHRNLSGSYDLDSRIHDAPALIMMLVPREITGGIIGKNGENIKNISKISECFLVINESQMLPENVNVLYIQGKPAGIQKAVGFICEIHSKTAHTIEVNIPEDTRPSFLEQHCSESFYSFTTDLEVGELIIGRRGSTVNRIKLGSGVQLRVENMKSSSRIEITGRPSSIALALLMIDIELNKYGEASPRRSYHVEGQNYQRKNSAPIGRNGGIPGVSQN